MRTVYRNIMSHQWEWCIERLCPANENGVWKDYVQPLRMVYGKIMSNPMRMVYGKIMYGQWDWCMERLCHANENGVWKNYVLPMRMVYGKIMSRQWEWCIERLCLSNKNGVWKDYVPPMRMVYRKITVSHFSYAPLFQGPYFFSKMLESNILFDNLLIDFLSVCWHQKYIQNHSCETFCCVKGNFTYFDKNSRTTWTSIFSICVLC